MLEAPIANLARRGTAGARYLPASCSVLAGVQTIRSWGDLVSAIVLSPRFIGVSSSLIYYLIAPQLWRAPGYADFGTPCWSWSSPWWAPLSSCPALAAVRKRSASLRSPLYGVEQETAVAAAAMVIWLITFAACTLAGVPILFREGWSLGELRRMRAQEDEELDAEMAEPS